MIRQWGLSLLLLVLLVGSFWLLEKLTPDTALPNSEALQQKPDYSVEDFTTLIMDEKGLPKRRLQAKRMLHYSNNDTSELEDPYLVFFATETRDEPEGKAVVPQVYPIWHAKSEQGRVLGNSETIFLMGKVHMWKNDDTGTMEMDIRTRNLKILPDSNYGETDEMVVIHTVTSETRSVGMRARIKPTHIELLSQVQTNYKPVMHNE
uniref:Lipopolysaccharide export system protein LptC n=1 Tax=Candidatus Kentrum eta TaxID=2126337 RepID=A0A450UNI3_9GAMM|nr:MAG: lipopolysaccharide export system protein LptC [Candidatus Kentron sp. H]VFJ94020.1 MAG: lipopolysaccharide export system protein LptC [Candidatus Kentron sp. H]VFK00689.1 MAG: lipopolysaccharide export system protein LptC [Candidatus Kentron sp. H]